MKAATILNQAAQIVEGSRQQTHGHKERSFGAIASFWNVYLRQRGMLHLMLEPVDVAQMMVLLKMARSITGDGSHPDHHIDQVGYSGLAGELATLDECDLTESSEG
jgi:hypothetical protein